MRHLYVYVALKIISYFIGPSGDLINNDRARSISSVHKEGTEALSGAKPREPNELKESISSVELKKKDLKGKEKLQFSSESGCLNLIPSTCEYKSQPNESADSSSRDRLLK